MWLSWLLTQTFDVFWGMVFLYGELFITLPNYFL